MMSCKEITAVSNVQLGTKSFTIELPIVGERIYYIELSNSPIDLSLVWNRDYNVSVTSTIPIVTAFSFEYEIVTSEKEYYVTQVILPISPYIKGSRKCYKVFKQVVPATSGSFLLYLHNICIDSSVTVTGVVGTKLVTPGITITLGEYVQSAVTVNYSIQDKDEDTFEFLLLVQTSQSAEPVELRVVIITP